MPGFGMARKPGWLQQGGLGAVRLERQSRGGERGGQHATLFAVVLGAGPRRRTCFQVRMAVRRPRQEAGLSIQKLRRTPGGA